MALKIWPSKYKGKPFFLNLNTASAGAGALMVPDKPVFLMANWRSI